MGADRDLTGRYAALAELAEAQTAAAAAGEWEELRRLCAVGDRLAGTLPARPPREARGMLERALAATRETDRLLRTGMAEARAGLARIERGRTSTRAYAGAAAPLVDARS